MSYRSRYEHTTQTKKINYFHANEIFEYIFQCNHDVDEDLLHRPFWWYWIVAFTAIITVIKHFLAYGPVAWQFIIATMKASICKICAWPEVPKAPFSFRKFNYFISFAKCYLGWPCVTDKFVKHEKLIYLYKSLISCCRSMWKSGSLIGVKLIKYQKELTTCVFLNKFKFNNLSHERPSDPELRWSIKRWRKNI